MSSVDVQGKPPAPSLICEKRGGFSWCGVEWKGRAHMYSQCDLYILPGFWGCQCEAVSKNRRFRARPPSFPLPTVGEICLRVIIRVISILIRCPPRKIFLVKQAGRKPQNTPPNPVLTGVPSQMIIGCIHQAPPPQSTQSPFLLSFSFFSLRYQCLTPPPARRKFQWIFYNPVYPSPIPAIEYSHATPPSSLFAFRIFPFRALHLHLHLHPPPRNGDAAAENRGGSVQDGGRESRDEPWYQSLARGMCLRGFFV